MDTKKEDCPDGVCEVNNTSPTPLSKKVCMGLAAVLGACVACYVSTQIFKTTGFSVVLWSGWGGLVGLFVGAGFWGAFIKDN